jgi:endoglucanase
VSARRIAVVLASGLLLAGCAAPAEPPPPAAESPTPTSSRLAGTELYVNPESTASRALAQLRAEGDADAAAPVERIAATPTGTWFGGEPDPRAKAERLTTAAEAEGRVPVVVAYNLPERDCGLYSKGGAGSPEEYRAWAREVAAGIGDRPAVVVLEPDAIAHAIVGCDGAPVAQERYALLAEAVDVFTALPRVKVYLDAGNATWIDDTGKVAEALRASGVERGDGFALNVSNFVPTDASYDYGRQVSERLGGQIRFVIDTSRNGAETVVPTEDWCNPWEAKLGEAPTTSPSQPLLDALLWVKQPGDSDGDCKDGAPRAGQWWPEYAEALAT